VLCISLQNHSTTHTHTHPFNGPFSGTTQVSRYQKGKTNLDFTEYDTIRDAILTCARKPTWVGLIYHTDRQLKSVKTEKTKSRKQICPEITVNSPGNPCSKYLSRKKGRATVGYSKRQWVSVASAGPYASLHLAPDRYHTNTPLLCFLQAGCPSCHPTNSIKALKAIQNHSTWKWETFLGDSLHLFDHCYISSSS